MSKALRMNEKRMLFAGEESGVGILPGNARREGCVAPGKMLKVCDVKRICLTSRRVLSIMKKLSSEITCGGCAWRMWKSG